MPPNFQSSIKNIVVDAHDPFSHCGLSKVRPAGALAHASDAFLVYRRAYFARLTEALREKYEAVCAVLGHSKFNLLAAKFIARSPSTSYSLSDYGNSFDVFLEAQAESSELPYLPDLARFEKTFLAVFHKPQHPSLPINQFAALLGNPKRYFVFAESVVSFRSPFRVHDIWKQRHHPEDILGKDFAEETHLLMYKSEGKIFVKPLGRFEYDLFHALKDGMPLENIDTFGDRLSAPQISDFFHFIATCGLVIATAPTLEASPVDVEVPSLQNNDGGKSDKKG